MQIDNVVEIGDTSIWQVPIHWRTFEVFSRLEVAVNIFFRSWTGSNVMNKGCPFSGLMTFVFSSPWHNKSTKNFLFVAALSTETAITLNEMECRCESTSWKQLCNFSAVSFDIGYMATRSRYLLLNDLIINHINVDATSQFSVSPWISPLEYSTRFAIYISSIIRMTFLSNWLNFDRRSFRQDVCWCHCYHLNAELLFSV